MSSSHNSATGEPVIPLDQSETLAPLGARRLLVLGGIGLILIGMIFGDIFAVFLLHQNAARVGASLSSAAHAALAGDGAAVLANFQDVGGFLENRGTKVDTHVHMIAFGYLALMLALLAPWITLSADTKKWLAWVFLCGSGLLPTCVFLIHYVGLAYSPLKAIGWASILADLGGLLVIVAVLGYLVGLGKCFFARERSAPGNDLPGDASPSGRLLLAGGVFLVLLGFLHGGYYAAVDLYRHEALDYSILLQISNGATTQSVGAVETGLAEYGQLQGDKNRCARSHHRVRPAFHATGIFSTLCEPTRDVETPLGVRAFVRIRTSARLRAPRVEVRAAR